MTCREALFFREGPGTHKEKDTLPTEKMFFGLTTLGPQNSFMEHSRRRSRLCIFGMSEFESALATAFHDKNDDDDDDQVHKRALEIVYRGPVPEADLLRITKHLKENDNGFLAAVKAARADEEKWVDQENKVVSTEYGLSSKYQEHVTRHRRMKTGPADKYNKPMTASMEIGWEKPDHGSLKPPKMAKKSCEETVYAAELIKSGVFY